MKDKKAIIKNTVKFIRIAFIRIPGWDLVQYVWLSQEIFVLKHIWLCEKAFVLKCNFKQSLMGVGVGNLRNSTLKLRIFEAARRLGLFLLKKKACIALSTYSLLIIEMKCRVAYCSANPTLRCLDFVKNYYLFFTQYFDVHDFFYKQLEFLNFRQILSDLPTPTPL